MVASGQKIELIQQVVRRQFFRTDLRGVVQLLSDLPELRHTLQVEQVRHYSTLCYAQQRLLRAGVFQALQWQVWQAAGRLGLVPAHPRDMVDATGLERHHVSRYYVWRAGYRHLRRRGWPRLTLVDDGASHVIAGCHVSWGPSQDSPQFSPAVRQAARFVHWDCPQADTAYDGEHNHVLCRETLDIRLTIIPINRHNTRK